MLRHLHRDLTKLNDHILALGGRVEEALARASRALVERKADLARKVIADDAMIDELELTIDEECLKLLALHQPVAGDLRFITSAMKINNDLERIGDLAVNLAERAVDLSSHEPLNLPLAFEDMTTTARWMLRDSLDALVRQDPDLARRVCAKDDEVDELNRRHFDILMDRMRRDPEVLDAALDYLTASLHLERVADLATNIAEDVVFMVEAVVMRHGAPPED
ncbi:MAG: phosphate transport system regulatory protein PhoU [Planctomycetota bacterium]|nr:MAG: phosphate transport system regulatory protein PhoU [Planctomycetota bacterium]